MFLTNHVLTGIALGEVIDNELLLAPAAFASHFLLDMTPHYGPGDKSGEGRHNITSKRAIITAALDGVGVITVTTAACFIWPERIAQTLTGAFFAAAPDLFYIPDVLFGIKLDGWMRPWHWKIQWYEKPPGLITEIIWAALMLSFLATKL